MYTTTTPVAAAEKQEIFAAPAACANCGTAVALHYCPHCGQKHAEGRLHMRHLLAEFAHNYLGTDSGFFFTLRQMIVRPGHAVNEFLDGKRKPYLKPVQFYLLMLTLFFLVSELLNVNPLEMGKQVNQDLGIQSSNAVQAKQKYQQTVEVFSRNLKVIFSALLLMQAFTMKLLYRKRPYTFTELTVFSLYLYGVSYLLSCLLSLLMVAHLPHTLHSVLVAGICLLSIAYTTWAIHQFYGGGGVRSWLKAGAVYLVSYLLLMVTFVALFVGVAVGSKLMDKL
jgi:cellulose synthase/poly-beta-1,6-N-acetylglucosamine synthase-like glycosyltransferase